MTVLVKKSINKAFVLLELNALKHLGLFIPYGITFISKYLSLKSKIFLQQFYLYAKLFYIF